MKAIIVAAIFAAGAYAQTSDYGRTFRGVMDANQATRTRPFRHVSSVPTSGCSSTNAGETVYFTTGFVLYKCDGTSWSLLNQTPLSLTTTGTSGPATLVGNTLNIPQYSSTGGAGATSQLTDLAATGTGTSALAITCATGRCNVQAGDTVTSFAGLSASCTLASGTYTAYAYVDQVSAALVVGASTAPTCSGATAAGSITAYPAGSVPLWRATVTSGSISALTDDRAAFGAPKRILVTGAGAPTRTETASAVTLDFASVGGGSSFDPSDLSAFWHRHQFSMSFFTGGINGWNFGGPCGGNTTAAATTGAPAGPGWSGAGCYVFWPSGSTSEASMPVFIHGSTPKAYSLNWTGGRVSSGSGDIYYGISGSNANVDNGVFVRYNNASAVWQCVIRGAAADVVASTITGAPVDLARHRFTLTGTTTPNSLSCAVDGGAAVTVTGTIPTMTRALLIAGTPTASTPFWTIEAGLRAIGF